MARRLRIEMNPHSGPGIVVVDDQTGEAIAGVYHVEMSAGPYAGELDICIHVYGGDVEIIRAREKG